MLKTWKTTVWGLGLAVVPFMLTATPVQAGPWLDRLLGRPVYYYPQANGVAVPVTTNYAPSYVPSYQPSYQANYHANFSANYPAPYAAPTTSYYAPASPVIANYPAAPVATAPVTAATVPAAPYATAPASANVNAYYAPAPLSVNSNFPAQPAYVPAPVAPVAVAPVTAYMPVQQAPVAYVPSFRTTWFRVPVTNYRPVTVYQGVPAQAVPAMQPCNTNTWQVQRVPAVLQPPTAVTVPYAVAPPGTTHVVPPAATMVAPPATAPYVPTVPSGSGVISPEIPGNYPPANLPGGMPADQPPALNPNDYNTTIPNSASTTVPSSTVPISPPSTSSSGVSRSVNSPGSSVYQVKPIPVPDLLKESSPERGLAPPLLNPRERTASQSSIQATSVTPATWQAPVREATVAKPATPATRQPLWDDSGWRSAR